MVSHAGRGRDILETWTWKRNRVGAVPWRPSQREYRRRGRVYRSGRPTAALTSPIVTSALPSLATRGKESKARSGRTRRSSVSAVGGAARANKVWLSPFETLISLKSSFLVFLLPPPSSSSSPSVPPLHSTVAHHTTLATDRIDHRRVDSHSIGGSELGIASEATGSQRDERWARRALGKELKGGGHAVKGGEKPQEGS